MDVPVFVLHGSECVIHPKKTRVRIVDADGAMHLLSEARRALHAGRVVRGRFFVGEYLWCHLHICPTYYQFDPLVQQAMHLANLREAGGTDLGQLENWFADLVLVASGTMAEYQAERMDNARKRTEGLSRGSGR